MWTLLPTALLALGLATAEVDEAQPQGLRACIIATPEGVAQCLDACRWEWVDVVVHVDADEQDVRIAACHHALEHWTPREET